ncbi:MAG: haloacid dehalogenase type II [Actinomycetota bacterium]|jgi:2-haloacid dehalogenase|nr:haloacid dehalogenase type II [Actinomycetota bacterium]
MGKERSGSQIKGMVFDVFGTVVDWRAGVIREGEELGQKKNLDVDWHAFADEWRGKYQPSMERVRNGEVEWTNLDSLHRASLEELLEEFEIEGLSEVEKDHLNRAWHRLDPWPDSVEGLRKMKGNHVISPLSNGNISLLVNMAKRAGLPWDVVLSAETIHRYKPDPETYLLMPGLFDFAPEETMMAAAHVSDLLAAKECGLKTAYVKRPDEFGVGGEAEEPDSSIDIVAENFVELSKKL